MAIISITKIQTKWIAPSTGRTKEDFSVVADFIKVHIINTKQCFFLSHLKWDKKLVSHSFSNCIIPQKDCDIRHLEEKLIPMFKANPLVLWKIRKLYHGCHDLETYLPRIKQDHGVAIIV